MEKDKQSCVKRVIRDEMYHTKQKWGDCYEFNSTAKELINKYGGDARLYELIVETDRPILDTGGIYGKKGKLHRFPHHIVVFNDLGGETVWDKWEKDDMIPAYDDYSNVFVGKQDADIVGIEEVVDELGGSTDRKLFNRIDKKIKKECF